MTLEIDKRKTTKKLLEETLEYLQTELDRLATMEKSQFENGRCYAFMEMKTVFTKILYKER